MKIKATESQFHRAVADLLDAILLPPALWTTFPAGWGNLPKATAGRLRGAGLKAGFPDILVFFNGRATGIELKTEDGSLSKAQRHMFLLLRSAGVMTYVCRNVEDVVGVLEQASLPHRKTELAGSWLGIVEDRANGP